MFPSITANVPNPSLNFFVITTCVLSLAILPQHGAAGELFKHVEFRIKEQMASGTLVGSILEKAKLDEEVSRSELSRLSFNIVDDRQFASLFSINSDNGDVHTTAMIDREAVCLLRKECVFDFRVSVTSSPKFIGFVAVRIVIEDINDNSPRFKNNPINLIIPESPNINVEYKIEGATDPDSDELNSVRKYEMRSSYGDMFKLKSERKLDGSWDLSLVNLKPLNREAKDRYKLYVIAKDEGSPPKSGTATVNIEVTDINDNSPEFTENLYEVSVPEEAAVNAVVGQVKATDLDVGANGNVSYSFSPSVSSQVRDLFSIDATTGRIRVRSDLRYEAGKTFETIVSANDGGNPPRQSQAVLYLQIVDVGNTPPRVTVNPIPYSGGNALSISEATAVRTVVAHVSVEDRDRGENGLVDCRSISPQFKVRKFQGSGGYVVEIYKMLDRELSENINVTIECEDRGSPKLSARGWFVIKLLDDNDNDPIFEKQMYRGNLTERNKRGEHVLFVKAHDRDLGENASLRYSISMESTESSFVINSVSGEITAGEEFDRETLSQFSFIVKAIDGGKRVGACSVIIDILDINDNAPFFISSLEGQIAEKLPASSEVDKLRAEDRDEGINAEVSFALAEEAYKSPAHEVPFVVMPGGTIRTTTILDKEKQNRYTFPVIVKDKGRPSLVTTGTVTIHVVDSNEHAPVFVFPSRSNNSVHLRSDMVPGTIVAVLKATDRDKGRNGRLKYYISSAGNNNLGNTFTIPNASSGEIMLMKNLSTVLHSTRSNSWVIRLNVSVRDQGIPVLQATAMLKLHVTFVNIHGHGAGKSGSAARAYEDDIKYIIIACVVGGITVILSIIIVTIILCIRRPQRRRRSARAPVVAGVQEQGDGRHFDKQLWHSVPVDDISPTDTEEKKLAPGTLRLNGDAGRGGEDPKSCNGGFSPNSDLIDPYSKKHTGPEPFHGQPQLYTFKRSNPSVPKGMLEEHTHSLASFLPFRWWPRRLDLVDLRLLEYKGGRRGKVGNVWWDKRQLKTVREGVESRS
ncbi:protocadherin-11 X-linked [Elysia marginata]|uniref:Protocadherin-11 X-linked n=1 Tax=Elysia marginata TaxID=1093978 RepID=A0AAV4HTQ0_9GAST|nr:protocadherin-11 X-linked [Elysia marginata]